MFSSPDSGWGSGCVLPTAGGPDLRGPGVLVLHSGRDVWLQVYTAVQWWLGLLATLLRGMMCLETQLTSPPEWSQLERCAVCYIT